MAGRFRPGGLALGEHGAEDDRKRNPQWVARSAAGHGARRRVQRQAVCGGGLLADRRANGSGRGAWRWRRVARLVRDCQWSAGGHHVHLPCALHQWRGGDDVPGFRRRVVQGPPRRLQLHRHQLLD